MVCWKSYLRRADFIADGKEKVKEKSGEKKEKQRDCSEAQRDQCKA
jgi:hypothetical protein